MESDLLDSLVQSKDQITTNRPLRLRLDSSTRLFESAGTATVKWYPASLGRCSVQPDHHLSSTNTTLERRVPVPAPRLDPSQGHTTPSAACYDSMDPPADDYDTPWKTAVMRYFREFMAFFFPQVHDAIDWRQDYSFLDQELAQIAHDARLGRRRLDKLVRVSGRESSPRLLYIHLEIQRSRDKDFSKRIFTYHYRLFDRFDCPITSLVVLADPHPGWRPDWFGYDQLGCELGLHFPTVKLMDYWPKLDALLAQENAFAPLTAAHLMTLHTRGQHKQRFEYKIRLTELLYARNWDVQRILDLFNVLDWMMTIPPGLQDRIAARIVELNRSKDMPFESLMVRVVKDRVRKECMEEGRRDVLRRQLQLRFGPLPSSVEQRIDRAEPGELTTWVDKVLHAVTLDDVIGKG